MTTESMYSRMWKGVPARREIERKTVREIILRVDRIRRARVRVNVQFEVWVEQVTREAIYGSPGSERKD